uniref:NEDD1 gamma-tubulin ring complex targeting factor n=1 Tax=Sphaeramia orbicularis TaxID=375764 RepID=A0A672YS04_9TELE
MEEVTRLVSTGDCVKIWDAVSMAPLEQFNPHNTGHPVAQACWSSNNQYVVSASSSGDKLVVSSLKSNPVPVVELAEGKKQTRVCLSSSSQFLVSGGLDHCVHIWDLKTKRLHRSLEDHKEEVTCVSFNANDSHIASGSTSGDLVLHSLTTNVSTKAFGHGSNQPIHDLRLSMLKRSLLGSVSDSGTVVLWDSNTQKELHVFDSAHKAPGCGLAFSPASELLVVSVGLDKKIVCYDTASKIVVRSIRVESPLTSVDFTMDGTGLVVGSTQGKIYQYDLRNSSAPTRVTVAHKTSVTSLRFQSNANKHKSSRLGPTKIATSKRSSTKLSSNQPDPSRNIGSSPQREMTSAVAGGGVEVMSREAEGHQGTEQPPVVEKFSSIGRNSLDIFSPAREGVTCITFPSNTEKCTVYVLQILTVHCCYVNMKCWFFINTPHKGSSSSLEGEGKTTPTSSQQTIHSSQPAPPFFTPEPSLRRADGIQTQLSYDSPVHATPSTSTAPTAGRNIAEVVGQSGAAPFTSLQMHFIQNMIHETLEDFRDACHKDILNLQVEMVRQFCIQLNEIHSLIENYSVNESLVEEVQRLREENRKLRTNY